jgi:hypothetical protein
MTTLTTSLLLLAACSVDYAEPELSAPELTLGTLHAAETGAIMPLGESSRTISTESAHRLISAANDLAHAGPEHEHDRLVVALDLLADALREATPTAVAASDDVRHSAEELDLVWSKSIARGGVVRTGLEGADRALATLKPASSERARYRRALVIANQATTAIDPNRPVVEQYDAVGIALQDTVSALFAGTDGAEFELAEARWGLR